MTYAEYLQKATRIGVSIDCVPDEIVETSGFRNVDFEGDDSLRWVYLAGAELLDDYWNKEEVEELIAFEETYPFTEEYPMCDTGWWRDLVDNWDEFIEFVVE